jgi:hypothetical protein
MAHIKQLPNGKFQVVISNGFSSDGKRNRISKVIEAKTFKELDEKIKLLEEEYFYNK